MDDERLEAKTADFLSALGASDAPALLAKLRGDHDRLETPYHCWRHILHGLALLWEYRDDIPEFDAVMLAWLNHDRIYDATRSDSEDLSADLGREMCNRLGRSDLGPRVHGLILDTKHKAEPQTPAGRWLVGIDLAILGETREKFARYDADIRREYAHVPEADYRTGRARVLQGFLDRETIYPAPLLRDRFEQQARENLQAALDALKGR